MKWWRSGRRGSTRESHSPRGPACIKVARRLPKRKELQRECVCPFVIVCQCVFVCSKNITMLEKLEKKKTILLRGKHIGWDSIVCFSMLCWRCVMTIILSAVSATQTHYLEFSKTNWPLISGTYDADDKSISKEYAVKMIILWHQIPLDALLSFTLSTPSTPPPRLTLVQWVIYFNRVLEALTALTFTALLFPLSSGAAGIVSKSKTSCASCFNKKINLSQAVVQDFLQSRSHQDCDSQRPVYVWRAWPALPGLHQQRGPR